MNFPSLSYRVNATVICALIMCYATITITLNIVVDPLWCFSHENRYNTKQLSFVEREQKTNYLTYRHLSYDALLVGNSRVMYMDQNDFKGLSVFNYSVSAMLPGEYEGYIAYAQKVTANRVKTVFLGLSFASANDKMAGNFKQPPPAYYIEKASDPLNRLRMALNPSVLKFSWPTLKFNLANDSKAHLIFDRHNVARANKQDKINQKTNLAKDLDNYRTVYKAHFHYDAGFKADLRSLKEQSKGIRIVAFTTPVSKPMHCLLVEAGLITEYEQWIRDIVETLGELHHFEFVHSIAENYQNNFIDANHYLPQVGTIMINRLQGQNTGVPDDFGIVITRVNLEQQLAFLRNNFNVCR